MGQAFFRLEVLVLSLCVFWLLFSYFSLLDDRILVLDLVYFEFSFFEFTRLDDRVLERYEFIILDFRFYFKFFAGHFCPGEPSLLMDK